MAHPAIYCTTPSMTLGAALTTGFVPRYSVSLALLGSCKPPDGKVSGVSDIEAHCAAPLPRLFSRICPFNALTIRGVVAPPERLGSDIVVPSGTENAGT